MKVAILGANGKLGTLIGQYAEDFIPLGREGDVPAVDVVIDVSSAEGTKKLLSRLDQQPLLVGTTGDLPWEELEAYASKAPVAVVPNFSVGVPLLISLVQQAVKALPEGWDIEVVEAHHNQKKDAPSGTAKRIVTAIEEIIGRPVPAHYIC